MGNVESAIENLQMAITDGFSDIESIRKDPSFDPIRNDKRFIEFIENAETMIKLRSKKICRYRNERKLGRRN